MEILCEIMLGLYGMLKWIILGLAIFAFILTFVIVHYERKPLLPKEWEHDREAQSQAMEKGPTARREFWESKKRL